MLKIFAKKITEKNMKKITNFLRENYIGFNEEDNPLQDVLESSEIRYSRVVEPQESGKKFSFREYNPYSVQQASRNRTNIANNKDSIILNMSFVDRMRLYITSKNLIESNVYKAAEIDRRLFSKIMSDSSYKPSKDTCIALCIGLMLSFDETNDMLYRAGYVLSHSIKRDVLIEYCIKENIYDIKVINEILYRYEEKTLGR